MSGLTQFLSSLSVPLDNPSGAQNEIGSSSENGDTDVINLEDTAITASQAKEFLSEDNNPENQTSLTQLAEFFDKPFSCDHCDESFAENKDLQEHKKSHKDETQDEKSNPFSFSKCDKKLATQEELQNHFLTHDIPDEPVRYRYCNFCGLQVQEADLKKHESSCSKSMSQTGAIKKHYPCKQCDQNFGRLEDLKEHEASHANDNKYCCTKCDKKFKQKSDLKVHEQIPYMPFAKKCSKCDQSFKDRYSFQQHENECSKLITNTHKNSDDGNFLCQKCDQHFENKFQFNEHTCPQTLRSLQR